ncbi:MAG: tRNA (adenosine(37)-N6)-threonylcarbamoyltransferase complex dimerization subunit type 1 TsaB [Bacillota bacterium]
MFVLGIETATPVAGVAVAYRDRVLSARIINNKKTHSGHLVPMIRSVTEEAGISPGDLNGIAVSSGPGSFTGLRIGMTTAKTLAQALGIPIVGVSTLDALAYPLTGLANLICPILNARKNEVYTAVYDGSGGALKKLTGSMAVKPDELAAILSGWEKRKITFLGDGVEEYRESIVKLLGERAEFAPGMMFLPRGSSVAGLGFIKLAAGEGLDPVSLLPDYVRLSEAEVKWLQKQKTTGSRCSG